jgi:hypothetical protein
MRALRELLRVTHCLNAELCVRYNEWAVLRAKQSLADALTARDRCRATVAIAAHVDNPDPPHYLIRGSKP